MNEIRFAFRFVVNREHARYVYSSSHSTSNGGRATANSSFCWCVPRVQPRYRQTATTTMTQNQNKLMKMVQIKQITEGIPKQYCAGTIWMLPRISVPCSFHFTLSTNAEPTWWCLYIAIFYSIHNSGAYVELEHILKSLNNHATKWVWAFDVLYS